jgi:SAM-dependent methyltransferase
MPAKELIHKCLRKFGVDVVRVSSRDTQIQISGSFPPHAQFRQVGRPEAFNIHEGYTPREFAIHYDDSPNTDEWQNEVYQFSREILDNQRLSKIVDVGCGSGFKLMKYFGELNPIGYDVPPTCEWLRKMYPGREWRELDFTAAVSDTADLVICADVIEHVLDPNALLSYIKKFHPKLIVLSTPDRNLLNAGTHNGPPHNPAHIREWSFFEFEAYISSHFNVIEHFISNAAQCTQCILCRIASNP